ncbi:MAG: hypothetical protein U0T84_05420 [Chitinophagales bacterium]
MMNKIVLFLVLQMVSFALRAQGKFDQWPQLKAFHQVMSQTFHPSEEGNLAPIKKRSGELAEKALALKQGGIPEAFNNKKVAAAVNQLAKDSKKLDALVKKNGSDDAIKKSLAKLHDTFHQIVERCVPGKEHKE